MNDTNVKPQLMQFVREKGKRIPKILASGKIAKDKNNKVIMVREKGLPRGILVAGMVNGEVRVGWSYVNKRLDAFDKAKGIKIAVGRMTAPSPISIVPHQILSEAEKSFLPRCEKYFGVKLSE